MMYLSLASKWVVAAYVHRMSSSEEYSAQLRRAFQELQMKMVETKQRIDHGEVIKRIQKQREKVASLTKEQLERLEADRAVYRSLGRMFLKSTVASEIERHSDEIRKAQEKIAAIDRQKEYLEKSLGESEKNLREMIQSRP
uniref:Prefoldin subunit 1 n=2 Tax=Ascaris TaxID=6251 RepID=A0A0M3HRL2_ASCLU